MTSRSNWDKMWLKFANMPFADCLEEANEDELFYLFTELEEAKGDIYFTRRMAEHLQGIIAAYDLVREKRNAN